MDQASQRDLKILTEIAQSQNVTQRGLSQNLGIALGLTNLYLKRLVRKGYVKITTIPPNRLKYLITPQGIAQKTRLTYEYMSFSLVLYRETRQALRDALQPLVEQGLRRIALYGAGEAAELAYLTLREFGLQPVAVYVNGAQGQFLDLPVRPVQDLREEDVDLVIVASFDPPSKHLPLLGGTGFPREKLVFVVKAPAGEVA
jgi:hypothetical protein